MHNPIAAAATEYYRSGADKTQRFGQYYINYYMPAGTVWPELFYEEDTKKALMLILDNPHTSYIPG